ncbi:MAG: hypothetical protein GXP29_07305 [Planctomycetes bacterium]|nr:hypothetical protein [Planctomycetota bacterium]
MSELLERWLLHYDSIHRGWTPAGIANGVTATNGFAFPRIMGGYNLYRSPVGAAASDPQLIVGASGANASSIETFAWAIAPALSDQRFILRSIGGGGVESAPSSDEVGVAFDILGNPEPLVPNAPHDLSIDQSAAGSFTLTWSYSEHRQGAAPVLFSAFTDGGAGIVDYGISIGDVAYRARGGRYSFVTGPHSHDGEFAFSVRAVTAAGDDDGNVQVVAGLADALAPALPGVVLTEIVEA